MGNYRKHPSVLWSEDKLKEKIINGWNKGLTQKQVGKMLGLTNQGFLCLLRRIGLKLGWHRGGRPLSPKKVQAIGELWQKESRKDIEIALGVSQATLSKYISKLRCEYTECRKQTEVNVEGLKKLLGKILTEAIKDLEDPKDKGLKAWFMRDEENNGLGKKYIYLKFPDICDWLGFDSSTVRSSLKRRGLL